MSDVKGVDFSRPLAGSVFYVGSTFVHAALPDAF